MGLWGSAGAGQTDVPLTAVEGKYTHIVGTDATAGAQSGQGGSASLPSSFANHFVVSYDGKIYDPAGGKGPYDSENAWETAVLAGFVIAVGNQESGNVTEFFKPNAAAQETTFTPVTDQ